MRLEASRAAAALLAAALFAAAAVPIAASGRALAQEPAQGTAGSNAVYFPLTGANLSADWPPGASFEGQAANATWEADPDFGDVLTCAKANASHVVLPGLSYGQEGPFAIAVWAKMQPEDGLGMEYLLSHANPGISKFAFDPNQVALYIPERPHPSFGVVRAIVRDSTDTFTNSSGDPTTSVPFFLDSNGCVADAACAAPGNTSLFAGDGAWHLLGLSTQPDGGKGFRLYIDGRLAAEVVEGQLYQDSEGFNKTATGGAPLDPADGNLTLCGRADLDPERFFTGSLAHLFVWNSSVTEEEMMQIYQARPAMAGAATAAPADAAPAPEGPPTPEECTVPCADIGSGVWMCRNGSGELVVCPGSQPDPAAVAAEGSPATPAAACVTNCEAVDGLQFCFTADSQPLPCAPGSASGLPPSAAAESPAIADRMTFPGTNATDPASSSEEPTISRNITYPATGEPTISRNLTYPATGEPTISRNLTYPATGEPTISPNMTYPATGEPTISPNITYPATAAGPDAAASSDTPQAAQLAGHPLCSPQPLQGISTLQSCGEGYACAPLSAEQLAANFGAALPLGVGDIGACAYAPQGLLLPDPRDVPPAMAFFPLASQTLQSFPLPTYSGHSTSAGVAAEPTFGAALRCTVDDLDIVALDPVQYGRSGAFSVNLWFKPNNMSGDGLSYLFSHRGTDLNATAASQTGFGPNQIQIFLPNRAHPAYGVLRVVVKDYNDVDTFETWLDSDGTVAFPGGPRAVPASSAITPGQWHAVTVTAQPGAPAAKGYRVYLNGQLVNQIGEDKVAFTPDGIRVPVDGGDPLVLDGNPVLCARSDDPVGRHYDGELAHLSLFDVALEEEQVVQLYQAVADRMVPTGSEPTTATEELPVISPAGQQNVTRATVSGRQCQFPALYNGEMIQDCVEIGGVLQCQVEEGVWEACVTQQELTSGQGYGPSANRTTVDGEACVFPATFANQTLTDCASLQQDGPEMCRTEGGTWKQCEVAGLPAGEPLTAGDPTAVVTDQGVQCQLPLRYRGVQIEGCLSILASPLCWGVETNAWEGCPESSTEQEPVGGMLGVNVGASVIPTVPLRARQTTDGDACALPTVYEGEVLDDCVDMNGTSSCLNGARQWRACSTRSDPLPADDQGRLLVAQRWTRENQPCLLPAVYGGRLWFDCVHVPSGNGTLEACPTVNAEWERCSDVELFSANATNPLPFSPLNTMNRTAPGLEGELCPVLPSDAPWPDANCLEGMICASLPDLSDNITTGVEGLGYCVRQPVGGTKGVLQYLQTAKAPVPLAFFPLTGGSLESLLLPSYGGGLRGFPAPSWERDDTFGGVLNCSRSGNSAVVLDTVPYASNGSFAISMWMRRVPGGGEEGPLFSYLFSHVGAGQRSAGQAPNQVALFLANREHPSYGVLRAIVTDANDTSEVLTYLDSDGRLNSNMGSRKPKQDLNDGRWHMVTVSTHVNDTAGYALFIDGVQVGSLQQDSRTDEGTPANATAGDPAQLSSSIYLCSRYDGDPDRFYDGSVAHLMLWNKPLTPQQVFGLYSTYRLNGNDTDSADAVPQLAAADVIPPSGGDGGLSAGEITGIVLASLGGAMALATLGVLGVAHYRRNSKGKHFERYYDDAEGGVPPPARGAPTVPPAALPAALSIQLSNGKSFSVGGSDRGSAGSEAGAAGAESQLPRYHSALSAVSTEVGGQPSGVPRLPTTASGAGSSSDVSPFATAPSSIAGGSTAGDSVTVEPGRRGLFGRGGSARVVLPGVSEADPRSPFEP